MLHEAGSEGKHYSQDKSPGSAAETPQEELSGMQDRERSQYKID